MSANYYPPSRYRPPEWTQGLAAWKALPPERRLELRRQGGLNSCARIVAAFQGGRLLMKERRNGGR